MGDGAITSDHEPAPQRLSRRRVLGLGAAAGAAAWAAPALITLDAASAQTCTPFTLTWTQALADALNDSAGTAPCFVPFEFEAPAGAGFMLVRRDTSGIGSGTFTYDYNLSGVPLGGNSNYLGIEITQSAPGAGEYVELVIEFWTGSCGTGSRMPVENFGFTLLDIDLDGTNWTDEVQLRAFVGGTSGTYVPLNVGDVSFLGSAVSYTQNPTNEQFLAVSGPVASGSTDGNATFAYSSLIDTLVVRYRGAGGNQLQQIGISNLSGCAL